MYVYMDPSSSGPFMPVINRLVKEPVVWGITSFCQIIFELLMKYPIISWSKLIAICCLQWQLTIEWLELWYQFGNQDTLLVKVIESYCIALLNVAYFLWISECLYLFTNYNYIFKWPALMTYWAIFVSKLCTRRIIEVRLTERWSRYQNQF